MKTQRPLLIQNTYLLKHGAPAFTEAIARLSERVEKEGHDGVLSYRFFTNAADNSARGVIEYRDPQAWIGHHDIAMDWPEMAALHNAATLTEVVFLGPFTEEIKTWLKNSALSARLVVGNSYASGFVRQEPPRETEK